MPKRAALRNSILLTGGAAVNLFGPNSKRICLYVSAPPAGMLTVAFGEAASLTLGFPIFAGGPPLYLEVDSVGEQLCDFISIFSSVAGPSLIGGIDVMSAP